MFVTMHQYEEFKLQSIYALHKICFRDQRSKPLTDDWSLLNIWIVLGSYQSWQKKKKKKYICINVCVYIYIYISWLNVFSSLCQNYNTLQKNKNYIMPFTFAQFTVGYNYGSGAVSESGFSDNSESFCWYLTEIQGFRLQKASSSVSCRVNRLTEQV